VFGHAVLLGAADLLQLIARAHERLIHHDQASEVDRRDEERHVGWCAVDCLLQPTRLFLAVTHRW
jgi:hypothetical protein